MTESDKHLGFKQLLVNMLLDLKKKGMKIKQIQDETESITSETKVIVKPIRHLVKLEIHKLNTCSVVSYLAYIPNTDVDELEIVINGKTYNHLSSGNCYGTNLKEDEEVSLIEIKSVRKYGFKYDINYNGLLFLIILPFKDEESYRPKFQYKYNEEVIRCKYSIYDVTCKYRKKFFKFEIGGSNHYGKRRCLVLDYNYLDNNSYLTIKKRIKRFLIKHTKES